MKESSIKSIQDAISLLSSIAGWKDAEEQIVICKKKIEEIKAKEEAYRLETVRKAEERRIATGKAKKKAKKIIAIITPIVCACIAFIVVLNAVIIPTSNYNAAVALYNDGKYTEAISAFKALNGYKDKSVFYGDICVRPAMWIDLGT